MVVKILLLGDFSPVNSIASINSMLDLNRYDIVLMNLETPVNKDYNMRRKAGPHLSCDQTLLAGFLAQNMVVNLANNHIMDYGTSGLDKTIETCNSSHVDFIGAGKNLESALKPIVKEINGTRVGIVGCAETQFGIASQDSPGCAPIIHGKTEKIIAQLSDDTDICIVSVHGASERSPWPSPDWQDMLRGFIDAGAHIIHGHHSHVPQGFEKYNNGIIFYGLGNYIVDPKLWKGQENTLWSLIPELEISRKEIREVNVNTAVIQAANDNKTVISRLSNEEERVLHTQYLVDANMPLDNPRLLSALWQEVSIRMFYLHYAEWLNLIPRSKHKIMRKIRLLKNPVKNFFKSGHSANDDYCLPYVLFACKSHQSSISTALGVLSGEIDDYRTDKSSLIVDKMMPWSITGEVDEW